MKKLLIIILCLGLVGCVVYCFAEEEAQSLRVILKTDKKEYKVGDTIITTLKNNSSKPINYMGVCAFSSCQHRKGGWWCDEHECHGQTVSLEPGESLVMQNEIITCNSLCGVRQKKKFEYQDTSSPYGYSVIYSNEFIIKSE